MFKRILLAAILFIDLFPLFAQQPPARTNPPKHRLRISLLSGYQHEDFRWSIAGNTNGMDPNIYSELIWKQLSGPVAGGELEWDCWKKFRLRSSFSRLFVSSGKVTDMDYQGDDRTDRSYNGAFESNKGMSFSWRTTLEYSFGLSPHFSLIPFAGYTLHKQSLFLLADVTSAGSSLRSTYATTYSGATMGLRADIKCTKVFSLQPSLLYDLINYTGRADWNLIQSFRHPLSFEDMADGYNIEGALTLRYALKEAWSLFLSGNYCHSATGKGTDWLYEANGQNVPTQFNGAFRNYYKIGIGASLSLF